MNFKKNGIASSKKNIPIINLEKINTKKINIKNPEPIILKIHKIFKPSGIIFLWDRVFVFNSSIFSGEIVTERGPEAFEEEEESSNFFVGEEVEKEIVWTVERRKP